MAGSVRHRRHSSSVHDQTSTLAVSGGDMQTLWIMVALGLLFVQAATGYRVIGDIKIGGEGGWDYLTVDSAARRLYVSHTTHVVVVDLDARMIVGDIPDNTGVHGI